VCVCVCVAPVSHKDLVLYRYREVLHSHSHANWHSNEEMKRKKTVLRPQAEYHYLYRINNRPINSYRPRDCCAPG